jgi:hypothetical protein
MLPSSRYVNGFAGPSTAVLSSSFALGAIEVTLIAVSGAGRRAGANNVVRPTAAISKAPKAGSTIVTANDSTGSDRTHRVSPGPAFL